MMSQFAADLLNHRVDLANEKEKAKLAMFWEEMTFFIEQGNEFMAALFARRIVRLVTGS